MEELVSSAIAAFDRVVGKVPGFKPRPGQREMAIAVAEAFVRAELDPRPIASADEASPAQDPERAIACIQAGTGVGKSAAYIVPGVHIARARKVPLVLSTATTALQAQLVEKDLPSLSAAMDEPFTFAIAKGRNRYMCQLKALRLAGPGESDELDLDEEDESQKEVGKPSAAPSSSTERRVEFVRSLLDKANQGWDGDRDNLLEPPPPDLWIQLSAEQTTRTARSCPQYNQCAYYKARNRLRSVDVIVANHSLLLAAIGTKILPALSECLVVLDEGHHLPQIAVDQFAAVADLTALRWLDRLPTSIAAVAGKLDHQLEAPVTGMTRELKSSLSDLGKMVFDMYASALSKSNSFRFKSSVMPDFTVEPLRMANAHATGLLAAMDGLVIIRERIRDQPEHKALWATLFAGLGKQRASPSRHRGGFGVASG